MRNEFVSLKDNVDERLQDQADKLISNNENILAILDDHDSRLDKVNELANMIEEVKSALSEKIDELSSNISDSNEDFNNRIEQIKSSIIDREELINLQNSEKELLKNQIDDIKEEFELFKDQITRTNELEIPALFDEEKARVENMFDEFSKNLLMRLTDNESDIHYIKDVLSEERSHLIYQIELLRKDVDDMKDDNTVEVLSEEKAVLENSLTALRDDFDKIMNLEKDFVELRDRMEGIDSGLKDDVSDLTKKLKDFKDNLEDRIEKDSDGLYRDMENLNRNFESVKNNISSLVDKNYFESLINGEKERLNSIFENLASNNEDFKDRLEKRISYFEDMWSDNTKIKSMYAADIREEVENIRKEADIKYDNHLYELKEKMKLIEQDIYDWKNGNLNVLLAQLEEARKGIENFIDTSEGKKNQLLIDMLNRIETKENEVYSRIDERIADAENKLSTINEKLNNAIGNSLEEIHNRINESVAKYDEEIKRIEHHRANETEDLIADMEELGNSIREDYEEYYLITSRYLYSS